MTERATGILAAAALLGTGAAVLPAAPAQAHDVWTPTPGGDGAAYVGHHGGTHSLGGVCANTGPVTGWFWFDGAPAFVGHVAQGCADWVFSRPVVFVYGCDYKGCSERGYP
jgi:hypothetical protein